MPIAFVMNFKGATSAQYDALNVEMSFEPGGPGASGELFHWVAETDDGLLVTNVFDSEASSAKFLEERLVPAALKIGFAAEPDVTVHPIHCYLTQG